MQRLVNVRFAPKADIRQRIEHVCFVPEADITGYADRRAEIQRVMLC
jgi:hypothetical protein